MVRTGSRRPEAKKLRQGSDHRRCTKTDREARREPSSSRITSGPRLASGTGPVPPDSISQRRPRRRARKSLRNSGSRRCPSALSSRALWPAAPPAPGFSPRACCLPRTHCPREPRRLAWNNAAVQKRRPNTLGSQDQEFPGCPTGYFRRLVPTPPLAPSHLPTTLHANQRRMRHLLPLGHLSLPAAGPHSGSTGAAPACPSTGVYQPHHAGPPQQVPV
ncbi:uncharacterized protein LOC120872992 [Oryx dammah]|uniref:uncharacterized protein LOC120872992 n=1 Tax=Oryx dammah TaxID=59534 RepID=UPI001A9B1A46|nr:uncharacterized protein LOC120872992 [Oryx dammah]